MKKIAWITDSTCGLSNDFIRKHNIHVLPLSVIVNGKSYKDDIDISKEEFYTLLKDYGNGAKTSQPAYGDFITLYEQLKEEYDCGIAIHASSELTGTYQSSLSASEMVGFPVEVIDSKIGAYPLGKMITNGIELEQAGKSYEQIVETVKTYPNLAEMFLLPENLEQLKKSGRVSTTQSVFASLMHINLLLGFDNGKVVVKEKVRMKKRAKRRLFHLIDEAIENHQLNELCILHAGVKEQAVKWKEELEKVHDDLKIKIETLVPVAGVHTGFGTMSVAWLRSG
ncbi:DegV family protein [Aquibacillus sediminis]|uniref:DegV family protein n=1 Tax=Aquibacillus sediminis TaxID=2574734 RepID=UPI0011083C1A|nr:DegV family protein [Aquibacillus sediminis]